MPVKCGKEKRYMNLLNASREFLVVNYKHACAYAKFAVFEYAYIQRITLKCNFPLDVKNCILITLLITGKKSY